MAMIEDETPEEKTAIEELKRRTFEDITPKMREDETLYYRFLKARDFNLKDAENMLRKHIAWRKEFQVDTILTDYKAPEVLVKYLGTSFVGYDKEGAPIRYIDMATDPKGILNSAKKTDIIKYNITIIEQDLERTVMQTKKLGKPVSKIVYLYNFENLTFAKATNKRALEMMLLGINIYQDNYPERIKIKHQFNASIYYSMLFSVVKNVIAPAILPKIHVYGSDGWKEALLKTIDADQLPVFLGGTRTDPDGNPLCHSFIIHAKEVPESYYLQKSKKTLSEFPGVKKLAVTRFSKSDITFEVTEPNSILEWEFETKNRDIGFALYFKRDSEDLFTELIPKQRFDTCFEPETGMLKCEKAGTYTVVFDNSYSWIFSKEIYYRIRIIGPNDSENKDWK